MTSHARKAIEEEIGVDALWKALEAHSSHSHYLLIPHGRNTFTLSQTRLVMKDPDAFLSWLLRHVESANSARTLFWRREPNEK
jgi:hypothetical protein